MISVSSFAKINLGLKIGARRPDGFHELRTIYQTLALHDVIRVDVQAGSGIEIRCNDPRVPLDESNTCYRIAERVLAAMGPELKPQVIGNGWDASLKARSTSGLEPGQNARSTKVIIEIEKRLPVQGGLGAASSNAVATMLGLEQALGIQLDLEEELRIAAEVGSDVPLFLIGGTVAGVGRGEQVYPLQDLPAWPVVVVTPPVGVSTPRAFACWDELGLVAAPVTEGRQLTGQDFARTIIKRGQSVFDWLAENVQQAEVGPASGVPAGRGDRAETLLLDLVRTGIQNDFERVVFPEYPELLAVKELLQREGAQYASLSGSGSTLYGLFASAEEAQAAAERMSAAGQAAVATTTLTREEYWKLVTGN